jgi:HK97 family phage prohead protease
MPGAELRAATSENEMPTLYGHFSVFDTPAIISSAREGTFVERVARGAFSKSIKENRNSIKVMFNHGRDPQIGEKPLGPLTELREDETGGFYSAELLDTSYNRDLIPALRAGLLGASFRFTVVREDVVDKPKRSAANPDGLPERTIREAKLFELGPVVNGAYKEATAGVRSITDYIADVDAIIAATPILLDEERTRQARIFLTMPIPSDAETREEAVVEESTDAPSVDSAEPVGAHSVRERRGSVPIGPLYGPESTRKPSWLL